MANTRIIELKQELSALSESDRREISVFLIKLGRESEDWKAETSRRLDAMARGEKKSTDEVRAELGHG